MAEQVLTEPESSSISLWSLFWSYLKIGSTAFGGFMALISVVQTYLVDKKKLMSNDDILDGISLASILPGPVAVNVVTYTGYKIRGLPGAAISFTAIILPSFLLIVGLSYVYFTYGNIPAVSDIFKGFMPAVVAIIVAASINLSKKSLTSYSQYAIAVISLGLLIGLGGFYTTFAIIIASGLTGYLLFNKEAGSDSKAISVIDNETNKKPSSTMTAFLLITPALLAALVKYNSIISLKLFTVFSGMSLMLFGGGFVFIPLMQEIVVDSYSWLTHNEFADGIALGQITPGPIVISATFIGYKVAGIMGAIMTTIGAFLPPAILMIICTSYLDKIKNSVSLQAILKGIRAGIIGMIAAAGYVVASTAEQNIVSLAIFSVVLTLLLKFKIEVILLIPLSGLVGYFYY